MVRALLEGRKTQTRRMVKPQPVFDPSSAMPWVDEGPTPSGAGRCGRSLRLDECPYGQPGDLLWVRESWAYYGGDEYLYQKEPGAVQFRATHDNDGRVPAWARDGTPFCDNKGWRPSIHMPCWACRLVLRVKAVRVERVQSIGMADAIAEGMTPTWNGESEPGVACLSEVDQFAALWCKINGEESWGSDPWVWVVTFEVAAKTHAEAQALLGGVA